MYGLWRRPCCLLVMSISEKVYKWANQIIWCGHSHFQTNQFFWCAVVGCLNCVLGGETFFDAILCGQSQACGRNSVRSTRKGRCQVHRCVKRWCFFCGVGAVCTGVTASCGCATTLRWETIIVVISGVCSSDGVKWTARGIPKWQTSDSLARPSSC